MPVNPMFRMKALQSQGITINLNEPNQEPIEQTGGDHFENLAFHMSSSYINDVALKMWKLIEKEEESYGDYGEMVAEIIDMAGLPMPSFSTPGQNNTGPGRNGPIRNSGATPMRSPAMAAACLELVLTLLSFLFLKDEIVDLKNPSDVTPPEVEARILRVRKFANAYLQGILPYYVTEFESSIWLAALLGSSVRKIHNDAWQGIPTATLIPPGQFFSGPMGSDFYRSPTKTHKFFLTRTQFETLVENKEWLGGDIGEAEMDPIGAVDMATAKIRGQNLSESTGYGYEEDTQVYTFYEHEVMIYLPPDPLSNEDQRPQPYVFILGKEGRCYSIKRNWNEQDPLHLALQNYVHYDLMPSPTHGGLGVAQLGGYNARAATILRRTMIDSALLSTSPNFFIKDNARMREHSIDFSQNKFNVLQTGDDDIKQSFEEISHAPPNPVIAELIAQLEKNIERIAGIVSEDLITLATQAPNSTVMNILQKMEMKPNSIIQRIYKSFCTELKIIQRKIYEWLPEGQQVVIPWEGETLVIMKEDFGPDMRLIPSGDYSYESPAYKLVRSEWIVSQARQNPDLHNMHNVMENLYKDLGLTEKKIQYLLVPPQQDQKPYSGNPGTENYLLMTGKPVEASLPQDHGAHIIVHQASLTPETPPLLAQSIMAHIQQHQAQQLLVQMGAMANMQIPTDETEMPIEVQNQIAVQLAQAAQEHQQQQQANGPPPPIDPGAVGMAEIEAQKEIAHLNAQVAMAKVETERQNVVDKNNIELMRIEMDKSKKEMELEKARFAAEKEVMEIEIKQKELMIKTVNAERDEKDRELDRLKKTVDMQLDIDQAQLSAMSQFTD